MAGSFRTLTGLDVSGIPVHRGPAVSEQARAYQARAFTRSGEIFLPDEAGPLGHSETRALLAHELTHAVQQRMLSHALPDETSPHGQELEGEASDAEQWFRAGGSPPPRLAHLPVATLLAAHAGLGTGGHGAPAATGGTVWTAASLPAGPVTSAGVQRQEGSHEQGETAATGHLGGGHQETAGETGTEALTTPAGPGQLSPLPVTWPAEYGAVTAERTEADAAGADKKKLAELVENSDRLAALSKMRPADLGDQNSLDELTSKVYPQLRSMLRAELLVDRERAGLLADLS